MLLVTPHWRVAVWLFVCVSPCSCNIKPTRICRHLQLRHFVAALLLFFLCFLCQGEILFGHLLMRLLLIPHEALTALPQQQQQHSAVEREVAGEEVEHAK